MCLRPFVVVVLLLLNEMMLVLCILILFVDSKLLDGLKSKPSLCRYPKFSKFYDLLVLLFKEMNKNSEKHGSTLANASCAFMKQSEIESM